MPVSALDSKLQAMSGGRRPRALPAVAAICAIVLFCSAAWWQYGRMTQKMALRAQLDRAATAAPAALPPSADVPPIDWADWRFRPVVVEGVFDASHQILIDNRIQNGQVGYHIVTPLQLTDGRIVLVNRGFVAGGNDRAVLPAVPAPAGKVAVQGRVALPTARYVELRPAPPAGPVWQNLDAERFAAATGLTVLPVVIEQTAALGASDTLVRNWPAPDLGVERHQIYMVQWLVFAFLAGGLWLYFNLRKPQGR